MNPARAPRSSRESARLLVIDSKAGTFSDATIIDLPGLLQPDDLLVVNDAATLPALLKAGSMEIRLAQYLDNGLWQAVLFGEGDWRIPTELRDPPKPLAAAATIEIAHNFSAEIVDVSPISPRLVTIRFNRTDSSFWSALYAYGKPIQYSYHLNELPLWSVQTAYAGRPWSVEMPSAGQPLTWSILLALKRRGVKIASLTHSAGLSAVGDDDLDARLPFTERYDIPQETIELIKDARRVIAVGTTVVRALESSGLRAGTGETDLIINKSFRPQIVQSILTGVHDPSQSHFRILHAFADDTTLRRAWRHATEAGYLCHEFGDLCLIN